MKTPFVLLVLAVLFLTGCASQSTRAKQIQTGMTRQQVIATLGEPERISSPEPGTEVLTYPISLSRFPKVPVHEDYLVILLNGTVDTFGFRNDMAHTSTVYMNIHRTGGHTNVIIRPK